MKLRGIIFSLQTVLAILFLLIGFSFGVVALNSLVTNYRTEQIKTFCNTIDNALQFYAKNHRAVYPSSLKVSETPEHQELLRYRQGAVYPANLNELGLLESQFGYFSFSTPIVQASEWDENYQAEVSSWKQNFISDSGFKVAYSTKKIDGNVFSYSLSVVLPNGEVYFSPHSSK